MLDTRLLRSRQDGSRDLMIVLHGLGDSMEGYLWLPDELAVDGLNYLLVNAPDDYFGGFSWFDINGDRNSGILRSRQMLVALLDAQITAGFPSARTILFGFSQGCLMTLDVGLRYPARLAGLVGISGWVHELPTLLEELSPVAREQRILMTHGSLDPLVPFAEVKQQAKDLQRAGLQLDWREYAKPHTIAGEAELSVIREFVTAALK
jgi:phospholipase/carboxylesterase